MYRLMLYFLILLVAVAALFSSLGILPFNFSDLVLCTTFLMVVCWVSNKLLSKFFAAPTNLESVYITALILALITTPAVNAQNLIFLTLAAILSTACKYVLTIGKQHLFNPAAFGVFITSILSLGSASWWVGNLYMLPPTLVGGLLIVRKINRFDLTLSFLMASLLTTALLSILRGNEVMLVVENTLLQSPLLFFAFVMLTEPQTTPPTKKLRVLYGGLVGLLSANLVYEMALLIGNIFSYITSPKRKMVFRLKQKIEIGPGIYNFIFHSANKKLKFEPGQYLEWTLDHKNPDSRGVRRYFTIVSSPTEQDLGIAIKFSENGSSFKKALMGLNDGDVIFGSGLSGDFTLPKDSSKKLVFIAGGIGITPFRSMIKYLLDINQMRDIALFYAVKDKNEFVFKDIFETAKKKLGIKIVYVVGILDVGTIKKQVPDFINRLFYLSGPYSMVEVFEKSLADMGVPKPQIKTDYFPGYV